MSFFDDDFDASKLDNSEFDSGMYGNNSAAEDRFLVELEDSELEYALESGDFSDVYMDSEYTTSDAGWDPFVNYTEDGKKANILGLPLNFCKTADPNGRVYKNTIMQDLPYVFILPGVPSLNSKLIGVDNDKLTKKDIAKMIESNDPENVKFAVRGARTQTDLRFMGFKANYSDYFKYVQTMLSTIHATMGLRGVFNFSNEFETSSNNYGLCYYADKSTSISESASNDYTESSIVQKANDLSTASREIKNVLGWNSNIKDMESTSLEDMTEALTGSNGILSRVGSMLGRVVNGSQLLYPEIWADSSFDRSYTINFKFYSPYGDKESIFKYVYVPFVSLLALALPRQDSLLGYGQPFVLRLSAPGRFESSMGVVSSITFTKGGNDDLWTKDGLPQEIEVNLNIKDLYPSLVATKSYGVLSYNLGLASFLDTMAGIRMDQLNLFLSGQRFIKTRLTVPSKILNTNFIKDFISDFANEINNILR